MRWSLENVNETTANPGNKVTHFRRCGTLTHSLHKRFIAQIYSWRHNRSSQFYCEAAANPL